MIRSHEIIKIVADLQEQGEVELAHTLAGLYMECLDSRELRFSHLVSAAKLGRTGQVMDLLEGCLETERWFSAWFLQRAPELRALEDLPRYRRILQASGELEAQYWREGAAQPILQVPTSGQPPYPLLVAVHGNGFNAQHSSEQWTCAMEAGWLAFHPLAKRLVGPGAHWWDSHEEHRALILKEAGEILRRYPVDPSRVVLGGFSKGGEVAMILALGGRLGAKGFITVGAGGYIHLQPDLWGPLVASPPPGVRGVALYSPYDLERAGGVDRTLEILRAAGVEIRLEGFPAEGHVFPEDFPARFEKAAAFVLRGAE